jgi:hypothetical protein
MASALGPAPEIAKFGPEAKSYLFLLGIALLAGICVAALAGPFILGPIYHHRAELNGAPFQAGDRVVVLVGARRGQVARVTEVLEWRGYLRVDWGSSTARKSREVFQLAQVIKVDVAEPPFAAGSPQAARRCP